MASTIIYNFPPEIISNIYLKSDCKTRKAIICVSLFWKYLGENSNYKLMIDERIRSLNSIFKIQLDVDILSADSIDTVKTHVKTYQLAIVNLLPPDKAGIASLPLTLRNPVSCYLRKNTYGEIHWRTLDYIDSLASKESTTKDVSIMKNMIKRSNRGRFEEALLLLDCSQSDNKNEEILDTVIDTHIQHFEYPTAIRLLRPLLLQENNLQIKQQAHTLFEKLISKVKKMNIQTLDLVTNKYECLTVISEIFTEMEDLDQTIVINKLITELKSTVPQHFLNKLERDVYHFYVQLRWAGEDFGKETYEMLRNAAMEISNSEEKKKALSELLEVLQISDLNDLDWIQEVEGLLTRITDIIDGEKVFRDFYTHMIYEGHFEEDLRLIGTHNDSIVRDKILDRLATLLKDDKKAFDLNLDVELFMGNILSLVEDPLIVAKYFR